MFGAPLQSPTGQVCVMFGPLQSPNGQVFGMGGDVVIEDVFCSLSPSLTPSYGYWAAVSISKGLNLGRGSACWILRLRAGEIVQFFVP